MRKHIQAAGAAIIASFVLSGCGGLSGMSADSGFKCKAPDGVQCTSMSGIAANLHANNLPGQHNTKSRSEDEGPKASAPSKYQTAKIGVNGGRGGIVAPGAIRSEPETIRIWAAWWEDDEGDLNEDSKVYLVVNPGRWLVEHNARKLEEDYGPTRLSISPPGGASPDLPIKPPVGATTGVGGGNPAASQKGAQGALGALGGSGAGVPQGMQNLAETLKQIQSTGLQNQGGR